MKYEARIRYVNIMMGMIFDLVDQSYAVGRHVTY